MCRRGGLDRGAGVTWLTFELRGCPHALRCELTFDEEGNATSASGPCLGLARGRPIRRAKAVETTARIAELPRLGDRCASCAHPVHGPGECAMYQVCGKPVGRTRDPLVPLSVPYERCGCGL